MCRLTLLLSITGTDNSQLPHLRHYRYHVTSSRKAIPEQSSLSWHMVHCCQRGWPQQPQYAKLSPQVEGQSHIRCKSSLVIVSCYQHCSSFQKTIIHLKMSSSNGSCEFYSWASLNRKQLFDFCSYKTEAT